MALLCYLALLPYMAFIGLLWGFYCDTLLYCFMGLLSVFYGALFVYRFYRLILSAIGVLWHDCGYMALSRTIAGNRLVKLRCMAFYVAICI